MNDQEIVQNRIKCKNCNEIIESKTVHDFVTCGCGRVSVDGGKDYLKRVFPTKPEECYIELSIQQPRGGVPVQKLPPGPEDPGLRFDAGEGFQSRYQPVKAASLQAAALQEDLYLGESERSGLDANYVRRMMLENRELMPSKRIDNALDGGQRWAACINAKNLISLTNQQLMAMLWVYWGNLQYSQAAEEMGCTEETVRSHLKDAKKNLILLQETD